MRPELVDTRRGASAARAARAAAQTAIDAEEELTADAEEEAASAPDAIKGADSKGRTLRIEAYEIDGIRATILAVSTNLDIFGDCMKDIALTPAVSIASYLKWVLNNGIDKLNDIKVLT